MLVDVIANITTDNSGNEVYGKAVCLVRREDLDTGDADWCNQANASSVAQLLFGVPPDSISPQACEQVSEQYKADDSLLQADNNPPERTA